MRYLKPALGILLLLIVSGCPDGSEHALSPFTLSSRPVPDELLFDYAGTFSNIEESTRRHLDELRRLYNIEACIVTLRKSPGNAPITQLAADILNNWQIGRDYNSRGLLFVFVESARQVKFEVAYELEDVFTDAFTGFVEDRQLRPNYRRGNLEVGIIAVFEEIEKRAELRQLGKYTPDDIAELDAELLSGGAGAKKKLTTYEGPPARQQSESLNKSPLTDKYAATPGQAWEIMVDKWAGGKSHADVDIYTESTKMAMGDQNNPDDQRVTDQAKLLLHVPYFVKQQGNAALIHFKRRDGWEYAPYLFAYDGKGWKFDIVSQRKYVVFGSKGSWHLERGDHNYNALFGDFKYSFRKDIPITADVAYDIGADRQTTEKITELEQQLADGVKPQGKIALELGRLGVMTARRPQHVYTPLNRAKEISPSAEVHKYLAIYHVMSNFQYKSALDEITTYNEKTDSVYSLDFQGFLFYKLGRYDRAVESFTKAQDIRPTIYGLCKLCRAEAMLYSSMSKIDPRRPGHKKKSAAAFASAKQLAPDNWRIPLLARWLRYKHILR
jgi:tetratricopeptide (TPR) repeat protein